MNAITNLWQQQGELEDGTVVVGLGNGLFCDEDGKMANSEVNNVRLVNIVEEKLVIPGNRLVWITATTGDYDEKEIGGQVHRLVQRLQSKIDLASKANNATG